MKKTKFTEEQITLALHHAEQTSVEEVSRKLGISQATFYRWKVKYGGLLPSEVRRLRQLEEENRRLKHMYAELSMDHCILKDIVEKKL